MALSLDFESLFEGSPITEGFESPKCDVVIDDVSFCNFLEADNFLLSDLTQGKTERETKSFHQLENGMSDDMNNLTDSDATSEGDALNSEPFFQAADRDLLEYFDGGSSSDEDGCATKLKTPIRNKENVDSNKNVTVDAFGHIVCNSNGKTKPVRNVSPMTRQKPAIDIGIVNKNHRTSNIQSVKIVKVIKKDRDLDTSIDTSDLVKVLDEKSRKNAEQAKLNREKKKAYLQSLETDVERLRNENEKLQSEKKTLVSRTAALEQEVQYLKNVLANESSLSKLLKNIDTVKDVRLSSSFQVKRRYANLDHSYDLGPSSKKRATAGICLHVDKDDVSLEFCSHCSQMAKLDKNK